MRTGLGSSQIRRIYSSPSSKTLRASQISVRFLPEKTLLYSVVVSKRMGSAVRRNKMKRQLREVVRMRRDTIPQGWYLLYVNRPAESFDIHRASDEFVSAVEAFSCT